MAQAATVEELVKCACMSKGSLMFCFASCHGMLSFSFVIFLYMRTAKYSNYMIYETQNVVIYETQNVGDHS